MSYVGCYPSNACTYACWACEESRLFVPPLELSSNFTIESTFELSDDSASRAQQYFRILLGWQHSIRGWHLSKQHQWASFIRCTPQPKATPIDHAECFVTQDGTTVIARLNGSADIWMAPACSRSGRTLSHPGAQTLTANRPLSVPPVGTPKLGGLQPSVVALPPVVFPRHTVARYFTLVPHGGGDGGGGMLYDILLYKGAAYGSRGQLPQVAAKG